MFKRTLNRIESKQDVNIMLTIGLYIIGFVVACFMVAKYAAKITAFIEGTYGKVKDKVNGTVEKLNVFGKRKKCKCEYPVEDVDNIVVFDNGDSDDMWDDEEDADEDSETSSEDEE